MADWTKKEQQALIKGVYGGSISAFNLPDALFTFTFEELMARVNKGFTVEQAVASRAKIAAGFRKNINEFSGAKTVSQVHTMTVGAIAPDGSKLPFKEYQRIASQIDATYNQMWLKVEQQMAFSQAQSADFFLRAEEQAETFPVLQYQTVNDGRVRPEHRDWDGIIKKVDDPFWDTHMPPCDWGCRCRQIQLRQGEPTNLDKHRQEVNIDRKKKGEKLLPNMKNSSDTFNQNPAKTKYIFKKSKTPYFTDADNAGIKMGKDNFGLNYK